MIVNTIEDPNPHAGQLIFKALENRWKKYRKELKRCRGEFSFDTVHDLRTAIRRILAFIQLLNSMSPRPRLRKLTRAFKDQLNIFDDLRNTQVTLVDISKVIQEFPQLGPFQEHVRQMEDKALRKARKKVKALEIVELKKRIRKTHEALETDMTDDLESEVLQAVDDAYLNIRQLHSQVDLARPSTIHRVRIGFKSFRYMIEIIHPILKDFPVENLKRMDDYQSLMGKIQDLEVFTQMLTDYSEAASASDLEPVRRYYEQRRTKAIADYTEEMSQLKTFWRASSDQPFLWQKAT